MTAASEEGKWRKQQIRMHALEMAVLSANGNPDIDVVERAIRFEDYIFRSKGVSDE